MQVDDPPYLSVGTAVSAKYKGAFCEAKVSKVVRVVKCKVTYKMGLGTATVNDDQIKGTLRVGQLVQAKHPEKKEFVDATITKIQDCSQYTVVFDDGDITTLKRTALCLKSGRHFNESETLDQLPLTNPEHFGNPVMGGRRGRRNRQMKEDSSEGEGEEENEPDLEGYSADIGRVVSVESTDKKRNKDSWFPGLVVIPSAQSTGRINIKDEYLIRSFKDGRYYTVPKKEVSDFNRELYEKVESPVLTEAVQKALKYLEDNELPAHWERSSLFNAQHSFDSDYDENLSDSSDDEPCEEKDRFVAQLYKFMDDAGTPLNKSPVIHGKDVDLYRLFRAVQKLGGYNRVSNQNKWKSVAIRLRLYNTQNTYNQVKSVYKKCLMSYESFYRTLGVTMLNNTRVMKKNRGRSLIRDKDRATPVNSSPKPEKEDEMPIEKKEEEKVEIPKKKIETKKDVEKKKSDGSDTSSNDSTDNLSESTSTSREVGRPKRSNEKVKEKKPKATTSEKPKPTIDKSSETAKKDETQQTRSKSQTSKSNKDPNSSVDKKKSVTENKITPKQSKKNDEEKKRGRKRLVPNEEKSVVEHTTAESSTTPPITTQSINKGDKLKVYYGPTHESKVTYEAKVVDITHNPDGTVYLVHYTGWNTRYDEWVTPNRIAENLSAVTKAKRIKQQMNMTPSTSKASSKSGTKRGRGLSITGRSSTVDTPRSTTPSSVTSSSSRTKSPATPATRASKAASKRRTSGQTDISNHSETDSDISEMEDMDNSRPGKMKIEDSEGKIFKKKIPRSSSSPKVLESFKEKEDIQIDKDEDSEKPKRIRKGKKLTTTPEKANNEESDEESNPGNQPPKGRDFDLNQIRSELKGFTKALKTATANDNDKDTSQTLDDSTKSSTTENEPSTNKEKISSLSEDIYEFKEPEPFEFESRTKLLDEKNSKKRLMPRLLEEIDKSPKKPPMKYEKEFDSPEPDIKRYKKEVKLEEEKKEDPFDKLVESPSYNIVKSSPVDCKNLENKQKIIKNILEEPLFRDLPETVDDCSRDMELSDCESQTQPIFTREEDIYSEPFTKNFVNRNLDFKPDDSKKDSDDDFQMRESIQRVIAQSSTDDDSNDILNVTPSTSSYQAKKRETEIKPPLLEEIKCVDLKKSPPIVPVNIEPLTTLLTPKLDDIPELSLKSGTKIADSILQKFNSIKTKSPLLDIIDDTTDCEKDDEDLDKSKLLPDKIKYVDIQPKVESLKTITIDSGKKKQRKVLSQAYIDESDSDSSDSEQLVIARSDEDSQTLSLDNKIDQKESDSNLSSMPIPPDITDESQSQHEELRNFKFDSQKDQEVSRNDDMIEKDCNKEDEPDSHLHSLLLCEETLPRSPAPVSETPPVVEVKTCNKGKLEMPFASAPSGSNVSKNILITETKIVSVTQSISCIQQQEKPQQQQQHPPPVQQQTNIVLPLINRVREREGIDNTPPATPESTSSNSSSRGEIGGLSPNNADNESCKSNEVESDFTRQRRNSSNKVTPYSEEGKSTVQQQDDTDLIQTATADTLMTCDANPLKKTRDEVPSTAGVCKKRRKSLRGNEEAPTTKRGRKPLNRSRHNSDSDDTSEHSAVGTATSNNFDRSSRSPRPSKYNFFVEFDPSLNSTQRIALLQQKLSELRKTYADVKTELAAVERRRKKLRRREREALKASKQDVVCA